MMEFHPRDEAWQRARSFARRFGEPHVRLAMHAAVPIGLTPELLHLIRVNFVPSTPWVSEADLLLSPLCTDVGGGFYEIDTELRALLVEELQRDNDFGPKRVREVADFLGAWAERFDEPGKDSDWRDFVQAQALTALSYQSPEQAAQVLARSLSGARDGGAVDSRVIKLAQGLSSALMAQVEVVTYAVALDDLAAGDVDSAFERFRALGVTEQPLKIGDITLPAASELGVRPKQAPVEQASQERERPLVYVSYVTSDYEWANELAERLSSEFNLFLDGASSPEGLNWSAASNPSLESAQAMIVLVSAGSITSDSIADEIARFRSLHVKPLLLPISIGAGPTHPSLTTFKHIYWESLRAADRVAHDIAEVLRECLSAADQEFSSAQPEPDDPYYVERDIDREAIELIRTGSSHFAVMGGFGSGKTFFLFHIRQIAQARFGRETVMLDPQQFVGSTEDALKAMIRASKPKTLFLVDDADSAGMNSLVAAILASGHQLIEASRATSSTTARFRRIDDFTLEQTAELNARFGSPLTQSEIGKLQRLLDGEPSLTRSVIAAVGSNQVPFKRALAGLENSELVHIWRNELGDPAVAAAWSALTSNQPLDAGAQERLLEIGLAKFVQAVATMGRKGSRGRLQPRNRLAIQTLRVPSAAPPPVSQSVFVCSPNDQHPLAWQISERLGQLGISVIRYDGEVAKATGNIRYLENVLDSVDAVIALVAPSWGRPTNLHQIIAAYEKLQNEGRPRVLSILIDDAPPPPELMRYVNDSEFVRWINDSYDQQVMDRITEFLETRAHPQPPKQSADSVYISYAREDIEAAQSIGRALEKSGISVVDTAGSPSEARLRRNIERSAVFLPLISKHTVIPERRFFRTEWNAAIEESKRFSRGWAFLLPILLEDVDLTDSSFPEEFRIVEHYRFGPDQPSDGLVNRVRGLIGLRRRNQEMT